MSATVHHLPLRLMQRPIVAGFVLWLRTHHGAIAIAALLAFAVPITFFVGNLGVMREPTPAMVVELALWYLLYGVEQGCLMLAIGYGLQRLNPTGSHVRSAAWLLGACAVSLSVNLSTAGRAAIVIEQGVADSVRTMHLFAFIAAFIMTLLFFAHLQRSLAYEAAAARLGAAQAAQREARRRMVHARLQAVQARIDPQLLFDMLDAVRRCYEEDALRAEHLLDELIAFLRAALPRLRSVSSSVAREAELACAYLRLRALADASDLGLTLDIATEAMYARFPPGVLLPLLDDVLRAGAGPCRLAAILSGGECRLVLALPARPSQAAADRVRALLQDLYGTAAGLAIDEINGGAHAAVTVPYETA